MTNGSATIDPIVLRGLSDEYGSWKMICTSRRSAFSSPPAQMRDVAAVEVDLARGRLEQPGDEAGGGALAAPALADDPQRLAPVDGEADPVDRPHGADLALEDDPPGDREVLDEVARLEQRLASAGSESRGAPATPAGRRHGRSAARSRPAAARSRPTPAGRRLVSRQATWWSGARDRHERRVEPRVVGLGVGAPGVEVAAGRPRDQARRAAGDRRSAARRARPRATGSTSSSPHV